MLAMLLRILLVALVVRALVEAWRLLGGGRKRPLGRPAPPAAPPSRPKHPPLEGEIVDAEFEDLGEGKRP